jgi:signal transduction histidine kinase
MKGKILVVEDDGYLLESIRDILEFAGYAVLTATSGQSGLDILRSEEISPDLIVSDIMMPIMDGYQFLNTIRADLAWVDVPFIFLTAKGERADANLGRELGADDYLTKPFVPDDLLVAVSSKLRRHRQLKLQRDQQIVQTKRSILTLLHHEFRTPLTYVVAYSDLLKGTVDDIEDITSLRMFLSGIDKGARRLRRLIEDFILLVELETGESTESFNLHSCIYKDMEALVNPLREDFSKANEARPHKSVEIIVDPDTPPIFCYALYLRKALDCLLDNAVKFGHKNNEIRLHVYPNDRGEVVFAVSDTGRGIPGREFKRIFEPFYQIDRDRNEDQGAGTGLTIAKKVAELHGGTIQVESEVGKGSIVSIIVPMYRESSDF